MKSICPTRNYGGQEKVAERESLWTQNRTSSESILQEWKDEEKLKEYTTSRPTLNEWLNEILWTEMKW